MESNMNQAEQALKDWDEEHVSVSPKEAIKEAKSHPSRDMVISFKMVDGEEAAVVKLPLQKKDAFIALLSAIESISRAAQMTHQEVLDEVSSIFKEASLRGVDLEGYTVE